MWMRWLDFRALRDLLLLVEAYPPGLRAGELERIATEEHVLLRRDGLPLAKSGHYHHRRTLERLGLLVKNRWRYGVNHQLPETHSLIARRERGEPLSLQEKHAFANLVIRNQDCHDAFFGSFLQSPAPARDVGAFVKHASPVELQVRTGYRQSRDGPTSSNRAILNPGGRSNVAIRPVGTRQWCMLTGTNAVQAVHFGLRPWCAEQLGFLDVTYAANAIYTIYARHIVPHVADRDLASAMFDTLEFEGEWATIRVADCALTFGIRNHVSIDQVKGVLMSWLTDHPDLVAGLPTREGFITHGVPERQHALLLKGYLQGRDGAYLSHLCIHQTLSDRVKDKVWQP